MSARYRRFVTFAAGVLLVPVSLSAQSASGAAASQLRALLDARKLDTFAARMPGGQDAFAAALYIPGQQLILVSGRYAAPSLLREKIILGRYRDAYLDLFGASERASRRVLEDLRADGLQAVPEKGAPSDVFTRPDGDVVRFDGEWKRQKISREDYEDLFHRADARYAEIAGALIEALKRGADTDAPPSTASAGVP